MEEKNTRLKHTQNITPRSKKDGRDHKICQSDKKYPNNQSCHVQKSATIKPEVVAQLVNKMRALIQEMKTVIGTVAEYEQLSREDPNTRVATNQERQTKLNK